MDSRRLDTSQVMAAGILGKRAPRTDIPEDRESVDTREGADAREALEAGKLLDVPEYYGCVYAWKDESGYHGRLFQYRRVTGRPDFATAEECAEWFSETVGSVAG